MQELFLLQRSGGERVTRVALPVLLHRGRLGLPLFSEEGALKGEGVHDVHLFEDNHPPGGLLALLHAEPAVLLAEEAVPLAAEQWNDPELGVLDPPLLLVVLEGAAVEESILLPRVPVEIAVQYDLSLGVHVADELLCVEYSRV